jgi:protein-disulfide isomerase
VLPVSGLAAGTYLAMLLASLFVGPMTPTPDRRLAWGAMLVLAGAAAGSAVWFTIIQKWFIGAFCPWCMAMHIAGLLLAALVIWRATRPLDNDSPNSPRHLAPVPALSMSVIGLALAGVLAICQVSVTPKSIARGGESQRNPAAIDPHAVPLVGSPQALHVVKLLFDYQCPHCQQMHFLLDEAVRRSKGTLAFALCPTPLSRQCNPHVQPADVDPFKESCELAKVALSVWLAKREALADFDRWMFSVESGDRWRPPSLEEATAKAVELVGQAGFDAAWGDPWIDRYLQTCIQIYGDTGASGVPKLVFGPRWVMANPYDGEDFVSILRDTLGVPMPEPATSQMSQGSP